MKKLLILDCDGVLYPPENISHDDFLAALNKALHHFGLSVSDIKSEEIINGSVFWNTIHKKCKDSGVNFEDFSRKMVNHVNYEKIRKSPKLLAMLLEAKKDYDIAVLSDNHKFHLECVLKKRFNMGIKEFSALGIRCYDITSTEEGGLFWPKNIEKSLINFCKKQKRKTGDCIFVDNNKANISAGKGAGIPSVYISKKMSLLKFLRQLNTSKFI